jgi:hypothetical protein
MAMVADKIMAWPFVDKIEVVRLLRPHPVSTIFDRHISFDLFAGSHHAARHG